MKVSAAGKGTTFSTCLAQRSLPPYIILIRVERILEIASEFLPIQPFIYGHWCKRWYWKGDCTWVSKERFGSAQADLSSPSPLLSLTIFTCFLSFLLFIMNTSLSLSLSLSHRASGAVVHLVCRNQQRGEEARLEIVSQSGNDVGIYIVIGFVGKRTKIKFISGIIFIFSYPSPSP